MAIIYDIRAPSDSQFTQKPAIELGQNPCYYSINACIVNKKITVQNHSGGIMKELDGLDTPETITSQDLLRIIRQKQGDDYTALTSAIDQLAKQLEQIHTQIQEAIAKAQQMSSNSLTITTQAYQLCPQSNTQNANHNHTEPIKKSLELAAAKINLLGINTAIITEKSSGQPDGMTTIAKEIQNVAQEIYSMSRELAKEPKQEQPDQINNQQPSAYEQFLAQYNEQAQALQDHASALFKIHEEIEKTTLLIHHTTSHITNIEQHNTTIDDYLEKLDPHKADG